MDVKEIIKPGPYNHVKLLLLVASPFHSCVVYNPYLPFTPLYPHHY